MGELILHIGTTKTGSTSLQKFLFDNREILEQHGICYPEFSQQPGPTRLRNGAFIDQMCFALASGQDPHQRVCNLDENLARLTETLSSHNQVLLSDEEFSYSTGRLLDSGFSPGAYWAALAKALFDVGARDITVIVYLRRQDDWAASHWRETVKSGRCEQPLEAFCNQPGIRLVMDYAKMIGLLEAALGKKVRVVVRRYDRSVFEGGDIYHDFCSALSIPWDDDYKLPPRELNASLTYDVAEALRHFVNVAPQRGPLRQSVLVPLARTLSKKNPDPLGITPFDEEAAQILMQPYLVGNEVISEKYLDGKPIFSVEYGGRPVWIPNEGRITENRSAFEKAIEQRNSRPLNIARIHNLWRGLPEGVKRLLKII